MAVRLDDARKVDSNISTAVVSPSDIFDAFKQSTGNPIQYMLTAISAKINDPSITALEFNGDRLILPDKITQKWFLKFVRWAVEMILQYDDSDFRAFLVQLAKNGFAALEYGINISSEAAGAVIGQVGMALLKDTLVAYDDFVVAKDSIWIKADVMVVQGDEFVVQTQSGDKILTCFQSGDGQKALSTTGDEIELNGCKLLVPVSEEFVSNNLCGQDYWQQMDFVAPAQLHAELNNGRILYNKDAHKVVQMKEGIIYTQELDIDTLVVKTLQFYKTGEFTLRVDSPMYQLSVVDKPKVRQWCTAYFASNQWVDLVSMVNPE